MSGPYEDIIHLPYPRPTSRPRMSREDRGAQFSPFAALTGFGGAILEAGRLTQSPLEMGPDGLAMLDEKLQRLYRVCGSRPQILVTYFRPDEYKSGGAYITAAGRLHRIDAQAQGLWLEDGTEIPFFRIYDIQGDLFP